RIPEHTRHNFSHIKGVLINIFKIVSNRLEWKIKDNGKVVLNEDFKIEYSKSSFGFNFWELYYLLMATIYHDADLLYGRASHGKKLTNILELENDIEIKGYPLKDICNIAKAHTGKGVIEDIKPKNAFSPNNKVRINIHFLAAILRIADEFHEGAERTNKIQLENFIDEKSKKFHYFSWMVHDVSFNSINKQINLTLILRFEASHDNEFKKEIKDFIIERIEKYFHQLEYCCKFDIKNMLYNKLKLVIIYYKRNNSEATYVYSIEERKQLKIFKEKLNEIFVNEIL
ncbi:MAG: hypothetical protein P8Y97_22065, partial [Candidatus Lokiarchaeota archaeon]